MKKKLLVVLAVACVLVTACGDKVSMEKVPLPTETTVSTSTEVLDSTAAPSGSTDSAQSQPTGADATDAAEDTGYLKTFTVTSCRGTAYAYAMSQEEIDGCIGTTLSYQPSLFLYNGEPVELPQDGYIEEAYPTDQFPQDFKTTASDLGIDEEEVLSVTLNVEGNIFGNYFYVLDDDTILVYYEGVFFEGKAMPE